MRVGDRVSFDWFGKRIAGHIESFDGRFAWVWSGLHKKLYEVEQVELQANPLH